jgi:methionine-rich copper-binding protein CopC
MRTRILALSLLLLGFGGANAHAHAMLASASPPVGGSVGATPGQVTLSFTQGLEPSFSSVQVTDSKGARVDLGKPQISGSTMSVGLKSLGPGTYKVHWQRVLSRHPQDARKLLLSCRWPMIGLA